MKRLSKSAFVELLLLVFLSIAFALLIESNLSLLSEHFSTYLTVSAALAGGSLTFAGIVLSYYLGEESRLLASVSMFLRDCLSKLQSWRSQASRSTNYAQSMYDRTEKEWRGRLSKATGPSKFDFIQVFSPFMFLIVSIIGLIVFDNVGIDLSMLVALYSLCLAVVVIFWSLISLILRLQHIQSMKTFFGSGKLWLKQINSREYSQPLKKIEYHVGREKNMKLRISFEGKVRNGFFHAVLTTNDPNLRMAISDQMTYFSEVTYSPTLQQRFDPKFDMGVIQGPCDFKNTTSEINLPLWLKGYRRDDSLRKKQEMERVTQVELDMYEDPIDLPSGDIRGTKLLPTGVAVERHLVDQVIIDLRYSAKQRAQ